MRISLPGRRPLFPDGGGAPDPTDILEGLKKALLSAIEEEDAPTAEAQVASLRAFIERGAAANWVKVGDLITAKANGMYHRAGEPCLVLEVLENPILVFPETEDWGSPTWGVSLDIRVLHSNERGDIHAHWGEAMHYEPWVAPAIVIPSSDAEAGR